MNKKLSKIAANQEVEAEVITRSLKVVDANGNVRVLISDGNVQAYNASGTRVYSAGSGMGPEGTGFMIVQNTAGTEVYYAGEGPGEAGEFPEAYSK